MEIHPTAAAGFAAAAEVYERARPTYPPEAIACICERTGLAAGGTVVDLGAGTGKLSRLLVATGARVVAVDPVPEMLAQLRAVAPAVETLDGTAEAIPLPDASADVVTVAQAFHWFRFDEALREIHRVLRPGGTLVLVWNTRDLADPLQAALDEVLSARRADVHAAREEVWRAAVERSPLFGPLEQHTFRQVPGLSRQDVVDRIASTSFVAAMPEAEREAHLDVVRGLVAGREEPIPFPYVTDVFVLPRR